MAASSASTYCENLVARHDEDLSLSLRFALPVDRLRLAALFAFQVELRRIPAIVSEPPLGEIRLQWWREALEEISVGERVRSHPVVEALAASGAIDDRSRSLAETLIDGRARLLYEPEFRSLADLEAFLADAETPLTTLAAATDKARDAISAAAMAYGLARFAPVLAAPCAPQAILAARAHLATLKPAAPLPALIVGRIAYLGLARGHAARPDGRAWPLGKRLTFLHTVLTGRL